MQVGVFVNSPAQTNECFDVKLLLNSRSTRISYSRIRALRSRTSLTPSTVLVVFHTHILIVLKHDDIAKKSSNLLFNKYVSWHSSKELPCKN